MTRYRKKPVVIEAWQLGGGKPMPQWLNEAIVTHGVTVFPGSHGGISSMAIVTLEGSLVASLGSWIIRGVKGELYPCDDEIFRMTYDEERGDIVDA